MERETPPPANPEEKGGFFFSTLFLAPPFRKLWGAAPWGKGPWGILGRETPWFFSCKPNGQPAWPAQPNSFFPATDSRRWGFQEAGWFVVGAPDKQAQSSDWGRSRSSARPKAAYCRQRTCASCSLPCGPASRKILGAGGNAGAGAPLLRPASPVFSETRIRRRFRWSPLRALRQRNRPPVLSRQSLQVFVEVLGFVRFGGSAGIEQAHLPPGGCR